MVSERTEVEVLIPVDRVPTREEQKDLMRIALDTAKNLVGQHGGRVVGLRSVARAQSLTSELALKCRYVVEVPEHVTERPTVITVDRKVGQ